MIQAKLCNLILSALSLALLSSCGAPSSTTSDLAASRDDSLDSLVFESACIQIDNGTAYAANPEQRASAILTINALKQRYAALPQAAPPHAAPPNSGGASACAAMFKAWEGRKLSLAHVGKVSLLLLSKLYGVTELDLSANEIDDNELQFFNNPSTNQHMQIHEKLQILNLANNRIKGEAANRLDYSNRFLALQRLDLSANQLTTALNIKIPSSLQYVSLANNPSLQIDTFKADSLDNAWESATSLAAIDLSGIKSMNFNALYLDGPKSIATLRLKDVGNIYFGTKICNNGAFPNLIYVNMSRSTIKAEVINEFTKIDKDCFPVLQITELQGSSQAAEQATIEQRHPRPSIDLQASCSLAIVPTLTAKGRYDAMTCPGSFDMPALDFIALTGLTAKFDGDYPVFPAL